MEVRVEKAGAVSHPDLAQPTAATWAGVLELKMAFQAPLAEQTKARLPTAVRPVGKFKADVALHFPRSSHFWFAWRGRLGHGGTRVLPS